MVAKLLGLMIGTPVQKLQQTGVGFISNDFQGTSDKVMWRDYATTKGNVIGDAISLGLYPPGAYLDVWMAQCQYDNFAAGPTISIGDVNYPAALKAAFALTPGGQGVRLFDLTQATRVMGMPLWQRLGYAADPRVQIELLATFGGANPPDGKNFAWQIFGRRH